MPLAIGLLTPSEINKITLSPYFSRIKPALVKFLRESRKDLSSLELFKLQMDISSEIRKVERQITYFSKSADRKKQNDEWFSREVYKAHRRVLKNIVDGIAWRYLKCLRGPLRLIAEHNPPGHLDSGFKLEAEEGERIMKKTGAVVLLNDLSNVLRYADLTIILKEKVSFYEVKGGKKDSRASRQSKKLKSVIDMLNLKEHTIGKQTAKVLLVESAPSHFTDSAYEVIKKAIASREGVSSSKLTPYLWFSCLSVEKMTEYYRKNKSMPRLPKTPFKKGKYTIPFTNSVLFDLISPNIAPYSIFPFDEEVIVDLLLGGLQIKAHLDEDELIKSFKGKGWEFRPPPSKMLKEWLESETPGERIDGVRNPEYDPSMSKGLFTTTIPKDLVYRIGFEFLSVKSIVKIAEVTRESSIPGKQDLVVTQFAREEDRWV